jgi:hypothetical protein
MQAITAGILAGASDLLAQRLTSSAPHNWRRTLSIAFYGFLWSGPGSHYWQQILERLFPNKNDPLRRWAAAEIYTTAVSPCVIARAAPCTCGSESFCTLCESLC